MLQLANGKATNKNVHVQKTEHGEREKQVNKENIAEKKKWNLSEERTVSSKKNEQESIKKW